eukprot:5251250-Ditylum_brightwellii.AAC.1
MPTVRIAAANYEPLQGENLTVIGMGVTDAGSYSVANNLLKAEVKYHKKEDCKKRYTVFREDSMLCAGGGKTDACQGDSGGPLLYSDGGEFVQIGIVSWGRGCGEEGNPGVYADVTEQREWIDKTICGEAKNSVGSMCQTADLMEKLSTTALISTSPSMTPSTLSINKISSSPTVAPLIVPIPPKERDSEDPQFDLSALMLTGMP